MEDTKRHGTIADLIYAAELVMALENDRSPSAFQNTCGRRERLPCDDTSSDYSSEPRHTSKRQIDKTFDSFVNNLQISITKSTVQPYNCELDNFEKYDPSSDKESGCHYHNCPLNAMIEKPPYSYGQLISQAISSSEFGKLTLSSIYSYIAKNYNYFDINDKGWQNSIRHNLSLRKDFVKLPKRNDTCGKGCYWTLNPDRKHDLIAFAFKKKSQRKISRQRHASDTYCGSHHCCRSNSYTNNQTDQSFIPEPIAHEACLCYPNNYNTGVICASLRPNNGFLPTALPSQPHTSHLHHNNLQQRNRNNTDPLALCNNSTIINHPNYIFRGIIQNELSTVANNPERCLYHETSMSDDSNLLYNNQNDSSATIFSPSQHTNNHYSSDPNYAHNYPYNNF